jgi:uncharacterized protein
MVQGWHDLASVHWRYEPAEVQALLPPGFTVDTFDGAAWVGLIPFHMRRVRVPHTPSLGPLSTFPETNVRTYIRDAAGRSAVWFFSLDISRLLPALVARVSYRLPYCWARMSIERDRDLITYSSRRRWPGSSTGVATSRMVIRVGQQVRPADVDELQVFLTARWALGTTFGRRLMWAEVEHEPWPVHRAELVTCDESMLSAAGLSPPDGEPTVLWSPGVEVRIGLPSRVRS